MREFPFPEVHGEHFCPEDLIWHRIARKYKLRYINKVIYIAEYQVDGISANMVKVRRQSPRLACLYYKELLQLDIPWKDKLRGWINYWRYKINII